MKRVVAGIFSSRLEADLAAEYFAEQGIAATVSSDDAGGTLPTLEFAAGVSVEVVPEDLETARQLLSDYASCALTAEIRPSTARRIQGILVALLFAAFVILLVVYAALNMLSRG